MEDAIKNKRESLLSQGVTMLDPAAVWVEERVRVGKGTVLLPGTILRGNTVVGENCTIGPNVMLTDTTVEDGATINAAQIEESIIRKGCEIGPYTHIRPHCDVGE
ncbi:MAG: UDP-N-acetylglucosamine diphosphorylase, partial [Oscillospiraceae bacterium]|nr:UDP-N-acetylglucosamine diphosphorylase [Oscillospiraceae bacterium]